MDAKIAADKVQNELQGLSDAELVEVYSSLKGRDEYKAQFNKLMHQAGNRLKKILEQDEKEQLNSNTGHAAVADNEKLVEANLTKAEEYNKIDIFDSQNKDFETTRAYLNNLSVVDEKGHKIDIASDIVEVAKLQTAAEFSQKKEAFDQTAYNNSLRDNIDLSIYGILSVDKLVPENADNKLPMSDVKKHIDSILNGKKQTVRSNNVACALGQNIATLKKSADELFGKFKKLDVVSRLKNRVEKVNDSLTQKLKQTYVKARTYAQMLNEQGVWKDVGMAAVAGIGGPVGMAAYGAWTFYRRAWPMVEAYKEEKKANPEMKNFWQYAKEHKKDAVMASLYTVTAVASAGIGVAGAVQGATATAAIAPLTQAKLYAAAGTIVARGGIDIWGAETPEERKKAIERTLFSVAAFAAGRGVAGFVSDHLNASAVAGEAGNANPDTTAPEVPTETNAPAGNANPAATAPAAVDSAANPATTAPEVPTETNAPAGNANPAATAPAAVDSAANVDTEVQLPTQWSKEMGISPRQFNTLFGHPDQQFIGGRDALENAYSTASNLSADQLAALGVKSPEELVYKFSRLEFQLGHKAPGELWVGSYAVDNAHPELGNFTDNKLKLEKLLNCNEIIQDNGSVKPSDLAGMKALLGHIDQNGQYHGIGDHVRTSAVPNGGVLNDCDKVNIPGHTGGGRIITTAPAPAPVVPEPEVTNPVTPEPEQFPQLNVDIHPEIVIPPVDVVVPEQLENPVVPSEPVVEEPQELEQPVLRGVGGNEPLDGNINSEAERLGTNIGADADGNVIRVDTPQNFSSPAENTETSGAGKGNKEINPFLLKSKINTFDL